MLQQSSPATSRLVVRVNFLSAYATLVHSIHSVLLRNGHQGCQASWWHAQHSPSTIRAFVARQLLLRPFGLAIASSATSFRCILHSGQAIHHAIIYFEYRHVRQMPQVEHLIVLWLCRLWLFSTSPSQSTQALMCGGASHTTLVTCPRTAGGLRSCQWVSGTTTTMHLRGQPIQALNGGNLMLHILSSRVWLLLGWSTISGCQARRNWQKLPGMSRVPEGNRWLSVRVIAAQIAQIRFLQGLVK